MSELSDQARDGRHVRDSWRPSGLALAVVVSALALGCTFGRPAAPAGDQGEQPSGSAKARSAPRDLSAYTDDEPTASAEELRQRAAAADDLEWLPAAAALGQLVPGAPPSRGAVLAAKERAVESGDAGGQARANAVLASEALTRASTVVRRWLDRRDPATGLLANSRSEEGVSGWFYQDTGSDLFPHIAIGAGLLIADRYPEMVAVLAAERRFAAASSLPDDLLLPAGQPAGRTADERMFNAAEYAKDGLLPLVERLGADPWRDRLAEVADAILAGSATPSRRGPIPADSNEVNGDVLQVLIRAYFATGDERYFAAADRIGTAYLEDMLPKSDWLPVNEWEFIEGEPIGRRRLRLSDHGNEIVGGLVGWHLAESLRGEPEAAAHRAAIRRMLDRMLAQGRNPAGLWYRVMEVPSGEVRQEGLSDNWGYLYQAYLAQAVVERAVPDGEADRAERYEQAAREALRALPGYAFYPWQRGEMDGYADSLEGALYLLDRLPDRAAARWVDEQVAVLFGFQAPSGVVVDNYLDGNFVRTALLYGLSLTGGSRLDPWHPSASVGAAADGECLAVALASAEPWTGRLRFDTPRHREHLRLPLDFPRLNEWPEWFVVEAGRDFVVEGSASRAGTFSGADLAAGLDMSLAPGREYNLRVCPRQAP